MNRISNAYVNVTSATFDEVMECGFEVIALHPCVTLEEWERILMEQYGTEVVDAFGEDVGSVLQGLRRAWVTEWTHPESGVKKPLSKWATSGVL